MRYFSLIQLSNISSHKKDCLIIKMISLYSVWHHTPLYLFESVAKSLKHSLHVAALLHGDNSGVVLLIDPDQEGLIIVVPEEKKTRKLLVFHYCWWLMTQGTLIFTLVVCAKTCVYKKLCTPNGKHSIKLPAVLVAQFPGTGTIITHTSSHSSGHAQELNRPYQIPLASGQSLAIKAHVNSGETGLSNKKWSYRWEWLREDQEGKRCRFLDLKGKKDFFTIWWWKDFKESYIKGHWSFLIGIVEAAMRLVFKKWI